MTLSSFASSGANHLERSLGETGVNSVDNPLTVWWDRRPLD